MPKSLGQSLFEDWIVQPVSGWSRADWVPTAWHELNDEDQAHWEDLARSVIFNAENPSR